MPPSQGPTIEALAFRLLEALKRHDERSQEPVFAHELAAELGLRKEDSERAFRYLSGKGWMDTFRLPYTGRINAQGHDALLLWERQQESSRALGSTVVTAAGQSEEAMKWDVFISHASEDKAAIALPLAERLRAEGLRVWLDKFELTVGDSLRGAIDAGLARSRFGIVIISPSFLKKHWPQTELDGLVARESEGIKVILPVWHQVDAGTIREFSPILAGKLAVSSDQGLDHVAQELLRAIRRDGGANVTPAPAAAPAVALADLRRLREAAFAFHIEHTERVASGHGPTAVLEGGMLIVHLVPYSAVDGMPAAAFDELSNHPELFPPMKGSVQEVRISYDGMLIGSNAKGLREPQRAYVNVYRTGIVEAVICCLATGQGTRWVELPYLQALVIRYVTDYADALSRFSLVAPLAVMVSLAHVNGVRLLRDFKGNALPEDIPYGLLNRDRLPFGQHVLEVIPDHYRTTARLLKPILTHLANAAGLPSSPYFDADGNYTLDLVRR